MFFSKILESEIYGLKIRGENRDLDWILKNLGFVIEFFIHLGLALGPEVGSGIPFPWDLSFDPRNGILIACRNFEIPWDFERFGWNSGIGLDFEKFRIAIEIDI